ncbi:MAG: ABC transporter permease [Betaproteobacteria bacterium]|nr:MAG: ABC transporter permease [Betaproteobacteria bacterium]
MKDNATIHFLRFGVLGAFLIGWELLTGGWIKATSPTALYFSSPLKIIGAFQHEYVVLFTDLVVTLVEAFAGLVSGTITGVLIGVLFARYRLLDRVFEPFFQAVNAVPRPALAPLLVIWFGLGMSSKILASWSAVFFVVFYNVYAGVKAIDPDYIRAIRLLGASSGQIVSIVVVPSVVSWIFAALRVSVAFSLLGAIVGEFAGATEGLGYRLLVSEGLLQTDMVYAILVLLMVVGVTLTSLAQRVEKRLLRWRPPAVSI